MIAIGLVAKPQYLFRLVGEHPVDDEIEDGAVYVVGGKDYQKWAYFRCLTDRSEMTMQNLGGSCASWPTSVAGSAIAVCTSCCAGRGS